MFISIKYFNLSIKFNIFILFFNLYDFNMESDQKFIFLKNKQRGRI